MDSGIDFSLCSRGCEESSASSTRVPRSTPADVSRSTSWTNSRVRVARCRRFFSSERPARATALLAALALAPRRPSTRADSTSGRAARVLAAASCARHQRCPETARSRNRRMPATPVTSVARSWRYQLRPATRLLVCPVPPQAWLVASARGLPGGSARLWSAAAG